MICSSSIILLIYCSIAQELQNFDFTTGNLLKKLSVLSEKPTSSNNFNTHSFILLNESFWYNWNFKIIET